MNLINQLFNDEAGFVVSSELVLIGTILVIGMITGLSSLRDGVVQELTDLSLAIGSVSQTYSYSNATAHTSVTNGSTFQDFQDFCETTAGASGNAPGCLSFNLSNASTENTAATYVFP